MTTTPPGAVPPAIAPAERVRLAYVDRPNTDYVFEQPGLNIFLTIITCGIYGYYVFYQLMRRMRDHNRRRLEMLEAANQLAWDRANQQGLADELRPNFERVALHLEVMRGMTRDFRDPAIWLVLAIITGFAYLVGGVFLDQDLVKHDQNEGAIEAELAHIFGRLGHTLPAPDPSRVKGNQNYAGRIVATIFTCGIYGLWWEYDLMVDVNRHFGHNWPWDDALANAVQQMTAAA
jgi:hypothetical protein